MNDATRNADLRDMLWGRRRELEDGVQGRLRDVRAGQSHEVGDDLERSAAHSHGDIELALVQMKAETLTRIDTALGQLDAGLYGRCFTCTTEIAEARLRALPFAIRCKACEEQREEANRLLQPLDQTRRSLPLFADLIGA